MPPQQRRAWTPAPPAAQSQRRCKQNALATLIAVGVLVALGVGEALSGGEGFVVGGVGIFGATDVLEVGVLGTDGGVVEAGAHGVG